MTNQYGQRLLLAVLLLCTLCFGAMAEQLQAEDTQAASFHSAKTEIVLVEDANILLKEGTSASYIVQVPEDGTYARSFALRAGCIVHASAAMADGACDYAG